ncbi:amidohydrolase [Natranaerobius trueperi]|uniref:5-methylthioadenosine/S-adenosylhomocysteine deaminase n=1 Tax=Natranaerobius trueperi TaxID=759412 RepID=A0A226BVB5_9FIRM|nr:amidohydrolase [Natranaerobius trueperi]OWZ82933.1 N-ethylammeline chlorohydrolase [Natranaerobius trueperi]
MSNSLIIENAIVITLTEKGILDPGYVLVEGDVITNIREEPFDDELKSKVNRVIDAKRNYLLPGFINTHTHAGMSLFRSYADDMALMDWLENKIWPAEANLSDESVYWGSLLSIVEMIRTGTTSFADMYFYMDSVAKAVKETGIRASLSRGMIGFKGEESLYEAKEFISTWNNEADGRITCMLAPHAPYTCPTSFLEKSIEISEELKVPIHIHVSETEGETSDSIKEYGKSPVIYLNDIGVFDRPTLAAHCVHLDDNDLEVLSKKKVSVSHNIGSNLKLGSGIAPIDKMLEKDVNVSLGTDGPSSNNNLDLLEEARTASLIQKGFHKNPTLLEAETVLKMATSEGAKSLKLNKLGKISPGYKADLILVDKNSPDMYPKHNPIANIIYSCNSQNISTVIVDGKVLMKDKEFLHLDLEKIYHEANKHAKEIINA